MSANMNWIACRSAIGLPKALRLRANSSAYVIAPSARPTPRAPTTGRQEFSVSIAWLKPSPSTPPIEVLARHAAVLEDDVRRRHAAHAHLAVLPGDAEARACPSATMKRADALRAGRAVRAREGDDVVGDGAAGDVHLLAVEDVVVAVADGARLEVAGVGADGWAR